MTKKDYEKAAALVQEYKREYDEHVSCQYIETAFVEFFACDNPHFDEARFRAACVPGANVKARKVVSNG